MPSVLPLIVIVGIVIVKHAIDVLAKHHKLKCVTNKRIIKYLHYYVDGS